MKCKKCGTINPDSNKFCGECGEGLIIEPVIAFEKKKFESRQENIIDTAAVVSPKKYQSVNNDAIKSKNDTNLTKNMKTLPILFVVFGVVIILIIGFILGKNPATYYIATNYLSNGQYCNAINTFSRLGSYKDSADLVLESKYQLANELLSDSKFTDANVKFTELGKYKDSEKLRKESKYQLAIELMKGNNYDDANVIFTELVDYKDSSQLKLETTYFLAIQYVNEGELSEAITLFESLGGYKDSYEQSLEMKYLLANEKINALQLTEAIFLLEEIADYKNSKDLLEQSKYSFALSHYKRGDFETAKNLFEAISNYKDSNVYMEKLDALISIQGTWESINGYRQLVFSGWKYYMVFFPDNPDISVFEFELVGTNVSNDLIVFDASKIGKFYVNRNIIEEEINGKTENTYRKISSDTSKPHEKPSPRIGMNEQEVLDSNWGSPKEINRTITEYSVSEQWVYPNYQYIYLDNGIVTAIQE